MLELKNISFTAENEDGSKDIIKNLNLKIDDGFVVITGPNGGGKSTLAKLIAGIIKPTSGQILFDGEDITELSITDIAYTVGFGNLSYFISAFKNEVGCTPLHYRKTRK